MATSPSAALTGAAPDAPDRAAAAAAAAQARARVDVRELTDIPALRSAALLFADIWNTDRPPINTDVLRALAHAGNYVVGAFDGEELLGASVAFLGLRDRPTLHSHISGVHTGAQGRSIGFALKLHQRAWAARRGIESVTWTFDPLIRRNAHFNLVKLGARATEYLTDFYGDMTDGINAGQQSDRLHLTWPLLAPHVIDLLDGVPSRRAAEPDAARAEPRLVQGPDGGPEPHLSDAEAQLCWIPPDIEAVRREDPARAAHWRLALRTALTGALAEGYEIRTCTRSGHYLLTRRNPS
ncbi:GNAT family N-acetyltransferase [Streptomyces siamensis]|uniref:N-acetyltransferase domain-containing protein n=1 Tax=Streptomyces siamensis TaxID=1274986 RepID=A0ABP9JFU8_9ACTN